MKYSKLEIGKALTGQLNKGYNIERISNWANDLLMSMRNKGSPEVEDILRDILIMDAGPEFEYTEQELWLLAAMLINEEKDPIKQINDIKSK